MATRCERHGQVEVGVVEHEGTEFAALGASVVANSVTGYTAIQHGELALTTWCGSTMLACRSEIIDRYWSSALAVIFRLTKGRFLVGYALGDKGMLFRGELVSDCTDDEARRQARYLADHFAELDAEDEAETTLD